ncbi:hypothetical protein LSTR_LSTR005902 [Laodelphax striatellus]|uniref:Uncharacterized protein n=1 Tax=Laodelphax striatellus TaxID=195883 RepID=A0A482WS42_LAOST|nr:hypothetical protein LSTR_LSTR005902 [Laodelphax striatellus]
MDLNSIALCELDNFDYNSLKAMFDLPDGSEDEGCGDDDELIDANFELVPPVLQAIQVEEIDLLEKDSEVSTEVNPTPSSSKDSSVSSSSRISPVPSTSVMRPEKSCLKSAEQK